MTLTELRRAAESLKHLGGDSLTALADHILSTVRDDDAEEISIPFAESIGAPPAIIRYENNRRVWVYKFEDERVTIRSRGQLRRLLEVLGVDSGK